MFFPAFYFPATGKIKGAYDTSSLTTAVAPVLAGAAPPAGNQKTSINLTQSKGNLPAQEWGRCTAEPSLSSFWWAQISALTMQEKELEAALPHTSHLWDTDIALKANEQPEHGLSVTPRLQKPHRNPYGSSWHLIYCTSNSRRKGLGSWRTWPAAFTHSQQGGLVWRNIMN